VLTFSGSLRVWVCLAAVDMRKSFHGLAAVARSSLGGDPLDGSVFLFTNRRRDLSKILCWDGNGLWVMAKRLEKGTYSWPRELAGGRAARTEAAALAMIIDGIDLRSGTMRPWFRRD
jgi:transposase